MSRFIFWERIITPSAEAIDSIADITATLTPQTLTLASPSGRGMNPETLLNRELLLPEGEGRDEGHQRARRWS